MQPQPDQELYERIYLVVEQIPSGTVATYGDIATIIGGGIDGRTIGYALGALSPAQSTHVPWQRVISRDGSISTRGLEQRNLLAAEGVTFDTDERVILARHRWDGPPEAWAKQHGLQTLPPRDEADRAEQLTLF